MADRSDLIARDPRIAAILNHPETYFAAARQQAWAQAHRDIEAELDHRARTRGNGAHRLLRILRSLRPTRSR